MPLAKEEGYDDDTYSSHVASIALALMMLLSASAFVMGVGGATGDGHVGGPGISDLTSGAGNHDAARAVAGGHREREAGSCVVAVAGQGLYPHGDDLIDVDARLSLPQTRNG